jgi:ubiquinol-cytochrome c reductase cytochrome b subunit/menaquinol-cytochrome c reductase cytochrome b/c subunit
VSATARKVINRRVRYETEYAASKDEGHPFFPYAMFHDTVVNLIIVLMIVAMAVVWHATAGPINHAHPTGQNGIFGPLYEQKANPAVQQTEPRPEWYFLFLFELLRIFKTPAELILATIIIPTIWMVLLIVWPFLDRGRDRRLSRRPWGVALGLTVPACLIALTIAGSVAPGVVGGSNVSNNAQINALPGAALIVQNGCTTCHQFPTGGAPGPGANLSSGSPKFGTDQKGLQAWISHVAHDSGTGMPAFGTTNSPAQIAQIAQVIASLKTNKVEPLQQ